MPPRVLSTSLLALALLASAARPAASRAADARVGDAGAAPDPAKFDDKYPDMKEWAEAGVRGGIPARMDEKVAKTLKSGDDIQAAIDEVGKKGGGVILLSSGVYPISKRLDMANSVVLRGDDEDKAILECTMRSDKLSDKFYAVRFDGVKKAGLEDLTIRHAEVARLGQNAYAERVAGPKDNPAGVNDLHVGAVQMERAEDCWIDNVNVLHTGSHPLNLQGKHLTVRDSLVDGAFNKGEADGPAGSGNNTLAVEHGLLYNNTFRNTRHALVLRGALAGGDCKFNVVLDCNFESDVNFHGNRKDEGHNLFEGTLVSSPGSHGWPAWAYWKRPEIGPENVVFKSLGWWANHKDDAFTATDPAKVYTFTGIRDPDNLVALDQPAPKAGTLYAVNASRPTAIDSLGAWPKTSSEAFKVLRQRAIKGLAAPTTKPAANTK